MKERPILFSGPMVKAILEGRKTQTRRICKGVVEEPGVYSEEAWMRGEMPQCPYGQVGDRLWVREAAAAITVLQPGASPLRVYYKADGVELGKGMKWQSPIHMPRWASRITLEITNVRVERLQDISEEDAQAEGIDTSVTNPSPRGIEIVSAVKSGKLGFPKNYVYAREYFTELWDYINGKRASWESNPWVWVIEFKKL